HAEARRGVLAPPPREVLLPAAERVLRSEAWRPLDPAAVAAPDAHGCPAGPVCGAREVRGQEGAGARDVSQVDGGLVAFAVTRGVDEDQVPAPDGQVGGAVAVEVGDHHRVVAVAVADTLLGLP